MAKKFVRLLAERLLEEEVDIDEGSEALREGVSLLPEGSLKAKIESDFESYTAQLNKLLSRGTKTATESTRTCATGGVSVDDEGAVSGTTDRDGEREPSLSAQLLAGKGAQLLEQYTTKLSNASVEECLAAVRSGGLACHSSHTMWLAWMNFCLSTFSHLADRVASDDTFSDDVQCRTRDLLLRAVLLGHLSRKADKTDPEAKAKEDDVMSALFSLYVDMTVMESGSVECCPAHLVNVMTTVLGHTHQHCLDALLQSRVPSHPEQASTLLPMYWRCLSQRRAFSLSVPHWLKLVCCYHRGVQLADLAQVSPPACVRQWVWSLDCSDEASGWMWSTDSSICTALGVRRKWSPDEMKGYLLGKNLEHHQLELLLDLVCGDWSVPLTEGGKVTNEGESDAASDNSDAGQALFFVDHDGEKDTLDQEEGAVSVSGEDVESLEALSAEPSQLLPNDRPSMTPSLEVLSLSPPLDIPAKRCSDSMAGSEGTLSGPTKSKRRWSGPAAGKRTPRRRRDVPAFSPKLLRSAAKRRGLKLDAQGRTESAS